MKLGHADVELAGVRLDLFPTQPESDWRWQLLYAGRLDPRKGVHVAIQALPLLPKAILTVVGVGEDDYEQELRGLAEGLPSPSA